MPQTVLVVEDDRAINEVVAEYVKDAGFIALSAENGASALRILQQNVNIDLFILDIMLPEISGLDLLKAVRASDAHKEKPVIMLTALDDEATQLLSFDELADDYVTKPFSPKVLVKRIQLLIRKSGGEARTLSFESLALDYGSYEVSESGEKVNLTLREFELLGALMSGPGRVFSRQQLLNRAWGYEDFGDERIVDVHIKNLRKKLKSNVIATIKGVGYKLERNV